MPTKPYLVNLGRTLTYEELIEIMSSAAESINMEMNISKEHNPPYIKGIAKDEIKDKEMRRVSIQKKSIMGPLSGPIIAYASLYPDGTYSGFDIVENFLAKKGDAQIYINALLEQVGNTGSAN